MKMRKWFEVLIFAMPFWLHAEYTHEIFIKNFESLDLYQVLEPYEAGYLPVSELHQIYYAQFGNPNGVPVLVVHGGPGAGFSDDYSCFFDLSHYRVIMFDQRGAMRSIPFAEMEDNTPQRSVEDMEALRKHCGVDKWILFGGSWGSALSLLYGETHPEHVLGFILRGIFLGREHEYKHLFYGMGKTFPEAWNEMVQHLPEEEREDLISAFHKRVMNADPYVHLPAAHAFMRFDTICGSLLPDPRAVEDQGRDDDSSLSIGRAFIHYSYNHFFLAENQLLKDLPKITHLPAILVHGRYDMICLPQNAYDLYERWNNAQLWFISDAGHFASEPSTAQGLREATDAFKILNSDFE